MKQFTKRAISMLLAILMVVTMIPTTAFAADSGERFLFAYFTGNGTAGTGANTQEIRFATSTDGINFTPLLNNNSAITQRGGTGNVRDPFIFKGHDGFYYIVGTDLNATTMGFWGNQPQIVFWKSADLITWTDETYINTAQICGLNNNQVQRTWAPEVIWDDALGKYMVYFAFAADGYNSTTMYYMTTSDLLDQSKYSQPQQLFAPGGDAIDADIIKQDSTYYMFYKDETEGRKNVCLATASSVTGPYTYQGVFGTSSQTGAIEGCEVFMIGSNYHLVADRYGDNGKFAIYNLGSDLSKLTGKATINMTDSNPVKTVNATTGYSNLSARHGSIVHISDAQYNALQSNAPHSVGQEVAVNGSGIASQIQSNLVAHYLIASGDQKPDFSGKNHNANTLDTTNTVWQNSGNYPYSGVTNIQGLYFKLNNEHDYFKAPIGDMFSKTNLDQGFTVSFMAKPDTGIDDDHSHFFEIISTSGNITWDGEAKTAHQYLGWFTGGNVEVVTSRRDLNGGSYASFGTRTAEKDAWHTYTLTLKRDEVKAYIDGELVGSTTTNANAMLWNGLTGSDAVLRIGNTAWPDNDYKGYMRDFRIYNKALSTEEAAQMGATHKTFAKNQATADAVAGAYAIQNNKASFITTNKGTWKKSDGGVVTIPDTMNSAGQGNQVTYRNVVWAGTSDYNCAYVDRKSDKSMESWIRHQPVVMLYDGVNAPRAPIMAVCGTSSKVNRWLLGMPMTDTDGNSLGLVQNWLGSRDYSYGNNWDYPNVYNRNGGTDMKVSQTYGTKGYENYRVGQKTAGWSTEPGLANIYQYNGSMNDTTYYKEITPTVTAYVSGSDDKNWNDIVMGMTSNTKVYVVNYKPIYDKLDAVAQKFDDVRKVQNPNYGAAELKEYYEAVAQVTKNPSFFFTNTTNDTYGTDAVACANWVKNVMNNYMARALAGPREHSFAYTTISEATCTDAGLKKITCSNTDCDYEKLETVVALGHIKASAETKANEVAATCETAGSYDMQYLCTRCSAVLSSRTVNDDPTGHSFTGAYYLTYTTDSLADADVTYQHYQKCANNEEHTNPTGCNWVPAPELSVEATAEQQGKDYEKCSVCGGTRYTLTTYNAVKYNITFTMNAGYGEKARSQTIEVEEGQVPVAPFTLPNTKYNFDNDNEYSYSWPDLAAANEDTEYVAIVTPKAHVYNDVVTLPTCGVAGFTTRTCTNDGCNHSYVTAPTEALTHNYGAWTSDGAGHHKKVCLNDCGDVIQEDCEFTKTTVDPTCTADGYDLYTCETCGYSYKEIIDKLGHDIQTVFVKSTCTEDGYYSVTCTRGDMTNSDKYPMAGFELSSYDANAPQYISWHISDHANNITDNLDNSYKDFKYKVNVGVPIGKLEITFTTDLDGTYVGNFHHFKFFDGSGNEIYDHYNNRNEGYNTKHTITVSGDSYTLQGRYMKANDKMKIDSIKVYPALPDGWTSADLTAKGHSNYAKDNNLGNGLVGTHSCSRCGDAKEHTIALARNGNNIEVSCSVCGMNEVLHTTANTITLTQNNLFDTDKFINSHDATGTNKTSGGFACMRRTDGKVVVVGNGDNYTSHDRENDYLIPVEGGKTYQFDFDASTTYGDVMLFFRGAGNGYDTNFLNMRKSGTAVGTNTIEFTVPEGGKQLYIRVGTNNSGAKNAYCVYSNFALHEKDDPNYRMIKDLPQGSAIDDYFTPGTAETCYYNFMNSTIIKTDGEKATGTTVDRNANVVAVGTHTPETDAAVAPKCTEDGLTEGSHCSVCGYVISAQETVDATGHTETAPVEENRVEATCTTDGSYDSVVYCSVCKVELSREHKVIPATGVHSYTGESVHTDADEDKNGYTEYHCVNGCNELGGRVYDEQDWDAYDAAVTESEALAKNTAKYTAKSIVDYKEAVEAVTSLVDKDDQSKSQAYIDRNAKAIGEAKSNLELNEYDVTFNIVTNDGDPDKINTLKVKYGTVLDFDVTDHKSKDSYVVKWVAKVIVNEEPKETKISSTSNKVSYVVYNNTTINCFVTEKEKTQDETVKVTLMDKSNHIAGIAYVESGSKFTKNGNELTVDGQTLIAPKYPYYQVKEFRLADSNTVVTENEYSVTEDIIVNPVYTAEAQIEITTVAIDVTINGKVRTSYTAKWDQTITVYNENATAWYANGVLVATGNTYKFQATQSVEITYDTATVTEGKSRIDYAKYESDFGYSRIVVSNCVPTGATVVEQGIKILTSSKGNVPSVASSKVIAGTKKFVASKTTDTGLQFMFTLTTDEAVKTIAVVSFVTYELNGETKTVWSSEGDTSATMIHKTNA